MQSLSETKRPGWWFLELEAGLLILLMLVIYLPRLSELPLRGEEPRRVRVAQEMLDRHDWVVPREQGDFHADRPPMGNWLIAVSMLVTGSDSAGAVRLPSVLATLLTVLLVYGYSRTCLTRLGAFAAGVAYGTMVHVLQLGRLAETDAVLTTFVSGSLLIWHWGYLRGWPRLATWVAGYGLAGLACLTKGPQGLIYFAAPVCVYLTLQRDWRYLFSWAHAAGAISLAAVIGAWQWPFLQATNWQSVLQVWGSQASGHFDFSRPETFFAHLASYPWLVLGCMLPWSLLLFGFLRHDLRNSIGDAKPQVLFLVTCILVTFPTCWLSPHTGPRHWMSLYPCFAPLVGLALQCGFQSQPRMILHRLWSGYLTLLGGIMVLAAIAVVACSWPTPFGNSPLCQSPLFAMFYGAVSLAAAALIWSVRRGREVWQARVGLIGLASFLAVTYTGLLTNDLIRTTPDTAGAMTELRHRLPMHEPLVSFGPAHSLFAYYYHEPIELRNWPSEDSQSDFSFSYFCFLQNGSHRPQLPFPWEEVAVIPCDRKRRHDPINQMVVGRRLLTVPSTAVKPHTGTR
jgi:4-amino-4-deoxy-L-arabinose transferase-like glycosyltransferase